MNMNFVMVWARMLWSMYAEGYCGLGVDPLVSTHARGARTLLCFGHGRSGHRMPVEQELNTSTHKKSANNR